MWCANKLVLNIVHLSYNAYIYHTACTYTVMLEIILSGVVDQNRLFDQVQHLCRPYMIATAFSLHVGLVPNPLSPHDALKHNFTSLYTDLIFLQLGFFYDNFLKTVLPIHGNFL